LLRGLTAINVGRWRDRLLGHPRTPQIRSLAVLPLANLSGDPTEEFFADGMTDALITDLGKISALRSSRARQLCTTGTLRKPFRKSLAS